MNTIQEAIADIKAGKFVVVVDDENRENEGDLIMAAEKITAAHVNFMVTHGRGLVCVPITKAKAQQLDLQLMVEKNTESHGTKFTVSIDAMKNTTTGISAEDRAVTIRRVVDDSRGGDFRKPGHVFPLIADNHGVLGRVGHTEASVDLSRLAGFKDVGVLCEILNEDGSMARRTELENFAVKHHLKMITIADLVTYRIKHEQVVENIVDVRLPVRHGTFQLHALRNTITGQEDCVLVKGDVASENVVVRIHSECLTGEVFGSLRCDCDEQLQTALSVIERKGKGMVIYLRQEGRGIGLLNKLRAYRLQDNGDDTVDANAKLGLSVDARDYGVAAQMLKLFGVNSVVLLSNNPDKKKQLEKYGVIVSDVLALESMPTIHNVKYLETKTQRMGHTLEDLKKKGLFL
jgi:3,4-dihydroxy 2-butanone 4-phosphate synthase / GTP cyclohydrolase II